MPGLLLPSKQKAILTPTMGPELNLHETIINVTPPEIGEVVVRIAWTGLCGSDATFSIGPKPGFPARNHIAGHEGIGHIVQSWDPADLGKPVALRYMAYSCQACKYCLRGLHTSCPKRVSFPQHHNGSFQQFATVPRHTLIPLPDYVFDVDGAEGGVSPAVYTAALCSGSAAVKALKAANPKAGDVVVVIGIGGAIGGLMGLIAKHVYAAKVISVDVSSKAGDPSLNIKTDNAVCDVFLAAPEAEAEERKFASELMQACRRLRGPNEVFDHAADSLICCSNRIAGFKNLVDYVCDGGTIIINGSPSDGERLDFPLFGVVERQINIHGHLMGGVAEMYQCLEYIRAGLIKPWIQEIDLSEVPRYLKNFKCLRNSASVCRNGTSVM
ncbi:GroES-like protein [Annulohypoxylon stygium]|nr:GroES-like protein [Annulohypoxylon stygium]